MELKLETSIIPLIGVSVLLIVVVVVLVAVIYKKITKMEKRFDASSVFESLNFSRNEPATDKLIETNKLGGIAEESDDNVEAEEEYEEVEEEEEEVDEVDEPEK